MRKKCFKQVIAVLMCTALLAGCSGSMTATTDKSSEADAANDTSTENMQGDSVEKEEAQDINEYHLRDKDLLYENDDETSVVTMYLTVSRGNSAENTDHSWEEINTYSVYDYDEMNVERYKVNGLLQVGDENGPVAGEVGYGVNTPNATVCVRGQTSSRNQQKNYKIELKKNKGTWREQRTINLNKHQGDSLRFRNKLMYDMMKDIPQIMSLRTQFVHLYVKDETAGSDGTFEDYGLYTQVEQLNKTALKAHGLDSNGQLYKINFFEFYRYEDVIKLQDDASFDQKKFEELLEIKGSTDHTKLIEMLEKVNDTSVPIQEVLEQYFDVENLTYWMAYMILTGNVDTQSRNVYIYSPLNSDKWYFLPWDNDTAFMNHEYETIGFVGKGSWECGISNYWGNVLFQRCLKSDEFRKDLDQAIQELRQFLNKERIDNLVNKYKSVVKPFAYQMPDSMNERLTSEQYDQIAASISDEVEENYQMYLESLQKPMPFYIGVPTVKDGKLNINWDVAYDFDAETVTYTVEVAKDYAFQNVIYSQDELKLPEISIDIPEAGQYFVRIRAKNTSGEVQDAFDYYVTDEGKQWGMKCFYVNADGTIGEDVYEE